MRMRGRGPRDAPASSAGAGDARRLAPPGRNPFVHELRLSALQKAQVGAARAPRPVAWAAPRRDSGEGSPERPSPAAAPQAPAARAPHAALRPASRIPDALTPFQLSFLLSRRPCPKPGSSLSLAPRTSNPASRPFPDPCTPFHYLFTPSPDSRTPPPSSVRAARSLVRLSTPAGLARGWRGPPGCDFVT